MIIHVRQEEKFGCGIACMAMILGKSYQDIKSLLPADRGYGDRNGMTDQDFISFMFQHGYVGMTIHAHECHTQRKRERQEWVKQISHVQIVTVINEYGPHAVLWAQDNIVFDPNDGFHGIDDYKEVMAITGFWKIKTN